MNNETNELKQSKQKSWQDSQKHFDQAAKTWDENPGRLGLSKAIGQAIYKEIEFDLTMQVMDFGCGTGLLAFQLAAHVATVIAADKSKNMLLMVDEKARAANVKNVLTLDLSETVAAHLERTIDVITTAMVLHHVKDIKSVLADFERWNKSTGYLAIADLNVEDGSFHGDESGTVHHGLDPKMLIQELNSLGYQTKLNANIFQMEKNNNLYSVFLIIAQKIN